MTPTPPNNKRASGSRAIENLSALSIEIGGIVLALIDRRRASW